MTAILKHATDVPALLAGLGVDCIDGLQRLASRTADGLRLVCIGLLFLLLVPIFLVVGVLGVVFASTVGASARLKFRDRSTGTGEAWAELFGLDAPPRTPEARQDVPVVRTAPEPPVVAEAVQTPPVESPDVQVVAADAPRRVVPTNAAAFVPETRSQPPVVCIADGLHTVTVRAGGAYVGKRDYRPCRNPEAGERYWIKDGKVWREVRYVPLNA